MDSGKVILEYPNLHEDLFANSGYNALSRAPLYVARFLEEFQDRLYLELISVPQMGRHLWQAF